MRAPRAVERRRTPQAVAKLLRGVTRALSHHRLNGKLTRADRKRLKELSKLLEDARLFIEHTQLLTRLPKTSTVLDAKISLARLLAVHWVHGLPSPQTSEEIDPIKLATLERSIELLLRDHEHNLGLPFLRRIVMLMAQKANSERP